MFYFILKAMYVIGFKKCSLQLANYWIEKPYRWHRHKESVLFDLNHSYFPRCVECARQDIPGYPHFHINSTDPRTTKYADRQGVSPALETLSLRKLYETAAAESERDNQDGRES